jgi:RNA polymerase sigma-70 factor (ECF subfamily)
MEPPRTERTEMELALSPPTSLRQPASAAEEPAAADADRELLLRVADGDRAAVEALYHRYVRPVFGLALRRVGDRGRAEDAVQETFAAVWRSARSYRPERGAASPWLYAVARNAITDRLRTRTDTPGEIPDRPSGDPGPADRAESDYVSWRVHLALRELPENEREVIELAYWSGFSQSEVAAFLDIPLGTVKTRTRSGLSRLAGLLEEDLR